MSSADLPRPDALSRLRAATPDVIEAQVGGNTPSFVWGGG